jgi:hypothetical protein
VKSIGYLELQNHGDEVRFRNMRIRAWNRVVGPRPNSAPSTSTKNNAITGLTKRHCQFMTIMATKISSVGRG